MQVRQLKSRGPGLRQDRSNGIWALPVSHADPAAVLCLDHQSGLGLVEYLCRLVVQ